MYKVAIIGCGWVGLAHASGYKNIEECQIVGAADTEKILSEKLVTKYGGNSYESIKDLLEKEKPDIVSVCTPPSSHRPVIQTALSRGVQFILCEKPLAQTVEQAREIVSATRENGAILMTAFCHRFIEPVQEIKKMLRLGDLGDPIFFRNEFSSKFRGVDARWFSKPEISGGGAMMDTSIHSVDLFRYLCGEVKSVSARTISRIPALRVEDSSCLLLQSEDGCIGIIEASWNVGVGNALLEIVGTEGRAVYEYWGNLKVRIQTDDSWQTIPIRRDINRRFEDELRHFIKVIKSEVNQYPSAEDGLRANIVIDAAYRSVKENAWIFV